MLGANMLGDSTEAEMRGLDRILPDPSGEPLPPHPLLDALRTELHTLVEGELSYMTLTRLAQLALAGRRLAALLRKPTVKEAKQALLGGPLTYPGIGPAGGAIEITDYDDAAFGGNGAMAPSPASETFGTRALRELVEVFRRQNAPKPPPLEELIHALAEAKKLGLDDVASALEAQLRAAVAPAPVLGAPEGPLPKPIPGVFPESFFRCSSSTCSRRHQLTAPVLTPPPCPYCGRSTSLVAAIFWPCDTLGFSVRTSNVLSSIGVAYIGQLVQKTEDELRREKNCGNKTIKEIREALAALGLSLGTSLPDWPALLAAWDAKQPPISAAASPPWRRS